MSNRMTLYPGSHIHPTALGDLHLDTELEPRDLNDIVCEMARRGLNPNDILAATYDGVGWDFELRKPLSD